MSAWSVNPLQPLNRQHPLLRGCAGFWLPLQSNGGGSVFKDLIARNRATAASGAFWGFGPHGFRAMAFDGTNDQFTVTNQPSVAGGVSHAAVIYLNAISGFQTIRSNRDTIFAIDPSGFIRWWPNSGAAEEVATVALSAGVWYHVAVTQTGTTYAAYVNGVLDETEAAAALSNGSGSGTFGNWAGAFPLGGRIAHCMDWTRAITAEEVKAHYLECLQGYPTLLNRIKRSPVVYSASTPPPPTTNRRRRLICGAAA